MSREHKIKMKIMKMKSLSYLVIINQRNYN